MATIRLFFLLSILSFAASAQTIGTFSSVEPKGQDQLLNIPSSHDFQLLLQTGQLLSDNTALGADLDFVSYVPLNNSSTQGYMSVSSESNPAKVACFDVSLDITSGIWSHNNSGNVNFSGMGNAANFCSGGVMPWGTVIVAEESMADTDDNQDGYMDTGWLIELNPANKSIVGKDGTGGNGLDKIWAAGRTNHENICVRSDHQTFYLGADHPTNGFLYKFVSDSPQSLNSGSLYVLKNAGGLLNNTTGTWVRIPNTTKTERNNTHFIAQDSGATNFNGIEDVEVGPDGRIYFSSKGSGRVYRFLDNGTTGQVHDVNFEVYIESKSYDVDGGGPYVPEPWQTGNDNLAFDGDGNLWVLQDGGRNHIWVVGPSHIPGGDNDIRLFATTPAGSEPTGINFTPDYKYMFMSIQHPDPTNSITQKDASGKDVTFNTHSTIVISRKEYLGLALSVITNSLPSTWKLSPNPAEGEITLTAPKSYSELSIKIFDDAGKMLIEEKQLKGSVFPISIQQLKSGNYQIHVSGKSVNGIVKFVKR